MEENIKNMSVKERTARISNELVVIKTGFNEYSKYTYITPEDLFTPLKPLLLKYRLRMLYNVRRTRDGRNEAVLRIEDFDTDVGRLIYTMNVGDITLKSANEVQSMGGLRTYCKRYLVMDAFDVVENTDDLDSKDTTSDDKKNKKEAKKDPTNEAKMELQTICREKIKENEGSRETIMEILKKFEPAGQIKNFTYQNAKDAIKMIKAIK